MSLETKFEEGKEFWCCEFVPHGLMKTIYHYINKTMEMLSQVDFPRTCTK